MCFGKIFLTIAWIVSFEATCVSVCCDYNPGCAGWISQAACSSNSSCVWSDSKCREKGCSDISGQTNCESAGCVYSDSTCREATSCNEINNLACDSAEVGGKLCSWYLMQCRVPSCADFQMSKDSCEGSHYRLNGHCKFDAVSSSCTLTTSCSAWNDRLGDCDTKRFDGKDCSQIGSECKIATCGDFSHTSPTECESLNGVAGKCKYNTDGTCTLTTSCSSWNDRESDCPNKYFYDDVYEDYVSCDYENSVCRPSVCSDYSYSTCYSRDGCIESNYECITASSCSVWDGDQTNCSQGLVGGVKCYYKLGGECVPMPSCSSDPGSMACDTIEGCFLSHLCPDPPVEEPPSHAIFLRVSSLLVVLLLAFLV